MWRSTAFKHNQRKSTNDQSAWRKLKQCLTGLDVKCFFFQMSLFFHICVFIKENFCSTVCNQKTFINQFSIFLWSPVCTNKILAAPIAHTCLFFWFFFGAVGMHGFLCTIPPLCAIPLFPKILMIWGGDVFPKFWVVFGLCWTFLGDDEFGLF